MSNYDKKVWQEEQAARDAAMQKQREKWAKAKARSARNALRKLERLSRQLAESGQLTDWEEEFSESVQDRLDKFGSAFQDPEKGRPADALSFSQKRVMAALKKKAKTDKTKTKTESETSSKPRSSFKSKAGFKTKKPYTPNVRHIEDDLPELAEEPYIPEVSPGKHNPPFLRIVK